MDILQGRQKAIGETVEAVYLQSKNNLLQAGNGKCSLKRDASSGPLDWGDSLRLSLGI